jgi:glycerol-1-phosphate dehydrogenase [NAD(P)+]
MYSQNLHYNHYHGHAIIKKTMNTLPNLPYDPADVNFWQSISHLPGFPTGEAIRLQRMVFASNALYQLPEILAEIGAAPDRSLLVVMDATPMRRGADSLKPLVIEVLRQGGYRPESLVLAPGDSGVLFTDMKRIESVRARLEAGMAVISLGSGVISDISKHACHLFEQENGVTVPYLAFQTANSVTAYTSNTASTLIQRVKRSLPSRYPDALVCDLETLADAPYEMTAAGVGDLLAAFVSFPDWRLAHLLGMDDTYSVMSIALLGPLEELFQAYASEIRGCTLEGMALLAKLIALAGLSMSLVHNTAPMSGYEHVISHVLDMLAESTKRTTAKHGSQVALATVLCAGAYEEFLDGLKPADLNLASCFPQAGEMKALILETFQAMDPSGVIGAECWSEYRQKLERWSAQGERLAAFVSNWETNRAVLQSDTRPAATMYQMLRTVGAPLSFAELEPHFTEEEVKFAFMNGPLMRKRMNVGDMLIFTNWDREMLWRKIKTKVPGL